MKNLLITIWVILSIAITGCSVGPDGSVSVSTNGSADNKGNPGVVVEKAYIEGRIELGPVKDIKVSAYYLNEEGGRVLVAQTTADVNGDYKLEVNEESKVIYLSAFDGTYRESSSQEWVYIPNTSELKQAVDWVNGETIETNINMFTTIAIGKMEYLMSTGQSERQALEFSKGAVEAFLNVDQNSIDAIYPFETAAESLSVESDELMLGMRTSITSDLLGQVNIDNGFPEHSIFTTIKFAKTAYDDVRADGYLDGIGYRGDGTESGPLFFGTEEVNEDFYRLDVARQTLDFIFGDRNKSAVNFFDYRAEAARISSFKGSLFKTVAGEDIDPELPTASWNVTDNEVLHGDKNFILSADDNIAIDYITLNIADYEIKRWDREALNNVSYVWDSAAYPDGIVDMTFVVVDILGNQTTLTKQVFNQNVHYFPDVFPVLTQTSDVYTNLVAYYFEGHYEDYGAGLGSLTVNGVDIDVNPDGSFSYLENLVPGDNTFEVIASTQFLRETTQTFTVRLDTHSPTFTWQNVGGGYSVNYEKGSSTSDLQMEPMQLQDTTRVLGLIDTHVSLNGLPLDEAALKAENRAFYLFNAYDTDGVADISSELVVTLQYIVDGVEKSSRVLPTIGSNQYMVPVSLEGLGADFYKVSPLSIHELKVTLTDRTTNASIESATFRLAAIIGTVSVAPTVKAVTTPLIDTDFVNRTDLHEGFYPAIMFEVTNSAGVDAWVNPQRTGTTYKLTREFSTHIKEHKVNQTVVTRFYGPSAADPSVTTEIGSFFSMDAGLNAVESDNGIGMWGGLASDTASCITQLKSDGFTHYQDDAVGTTSEVVIMTDSLKNAEAQAYEPIPGFAASLKTVEDHTTAALTGLSVDVMPESEIFHEVYFLPSYAVYCSVPKTAHRIKSGVPATNDIQVGGINADGIAQVRTLTEVSVPGFPKMNETLSDDVYYNLPGRFTAEDAIGTALTDTSGWFPVKAGETIKVFGEIYVPAMAVDDDPYVAIYSSQISDMKYKYEVDSKSIMRFVPDNGGANLGSLPETIINIDDGVFDMENAR